MEYPVKCKSCAKDLYGLVKYCPFCGQIAPFASSAEEEVDRARDVNIIHAEDDIAKKQEEGKPSTIDGGDEETVKGASDKADALQIGASDEPKVIGTVEDGGKRDRQEAGKINSDHGINVTPGDSPVPQPSPRRWIIGALCLIGVLGSFSLYFFIKHGPLPDSGKYAAPSQVTDINGVSKPQGTANSADGKSPDTRPRKGKGIKQIADAKESKILPKDGHNDKQIKVLPDRGKNKDDMMNPAKKQSQDDIARKTEPKAKEEKTGDAGEFKPETVEEMLNKGIGFYEKKQYAAAAESFKAILKMVPNNSVAKYYLGKSIDGQKQIEAGGEGAQ